MALLTITFRRLDLLAAALAWWLVCIFFLWRVCCNFNLSYWAGAAIILCDLLSVMLFKALYITASVGTATGVILWATAVYVLLRSARLSRETATA